MPADAPPRPRSPVPGWRGELHDVPRVVWGLVAVQLLLGVVYSVVVPLWHAPDEPAHVDLVHAVAEEGRYPEFDRRTVDGRVLATLDETGLVAIDFRFAPRHPWAGLSAAEATPRGQRRPFDALGPGGGSRVPNPVAAHPPLYATTLAGAREAVGAGGWSWDREVGALRLTSAVLLAPLPLLAWLAARRLGADRPAATAAAVVPLAVPMLAHLGGAVNNDVLLALLGGLLMVTLAGVWRGDGSRRGAALVGVLAGLALLTKAFALAAPAWIAVAYLGAGRGGLGWRLAARRAALAVGIAGAVGGWWYARQLAVHGDLVPRLFLYPAPADPPVDSLWWLGYATARGARTFVGVLGAEEVALPAPVVVAVLGLLAAGVVAALRGRGGWRAPTALLLAPAATTLVGVAGAAWAGYARSGVPSGLHGRYLFVGLVGLAVVVGVGWRRLVGRYAPAVVAALALVAQGAGLTVAVVGFWAGTGPAGHLRAVLAHAPWPAGWVVATAVALAGVVGAVLIGSAQSRWSTTSQSLSPGSPAESMSTSS